jgi:hypothetical protein
MAKQELLDVLETAMIARGMQPRGDLAGIFITKHNRKRYLEVQRVELTGRDGAPVTYLDAKEELLRRIAAVEQRGAIPVEAVAGSHRPQLLGGSDAEKVQIHKVDGVAKVKGSRR